MFQDIDFSIQQILRASQLTLQNQQIIFTICQVSPVFSLRFFGLGESSGNCEIRSGDPCLKETFQVQTTDPLNNNNTITTIKTMVHSDPPQRTNSGMGYYVGIRCRNLCRVPLGTQPLLPRSIVTIQQCHRELSLRNEVLNRDMTLGLVN